MATSALLQSFEALNHSERVSQMVQYGRISREDPFIKNFINDLSSSTSLYEQALSLHSCYGSHDISIANKVLQSPSRHLKKAAMNTIVLLGSDEELLQALQSVPSYLQVRTLHRMRDIRRGRKRLKAIEMFLQTLESSLTDKALFQRVFLLGSRDIVKRYLPSFQDRFSKDDWSRFIKYHPVTAQSTIREWASRVKYNDTEFCDMVEVQLPLWIGLPGAINSTLELVKFLLSKVPIDRFPIQALVAKRPNETVKIILDCEDDLTEEVVSDLRVPSLRQLDISLFILLFKRYPLIFAERNFGVMTPEQRLYVYQEIGVGLRNDDGVLDTTVVELLAEKERVEEARRHIKLRKFEAEPNGKIPYIALLPWHEAMELQKQFIQDSDADIRGTALKAQIAAAKWDEGHIGDALSLILHRKNEQDPVKREMMTGLEKIPIGRWKEEHLGALAQVIRNTVDSSDASSFTIKSILEISTDLLPAFPTWAKTQLQAITRSRDEIPGWYRPTGKAPVKATMQAIGEALSPLLKRLLANNDASSLWNLIYSFRTQAKHWTELLDTCEKALNVPEMFGWRQNMVGILKEHRPRTWHRVVPLLLAKNDEASGFTILLDHAHLRQQNLLWDNYIVRSNTWTRKALRTLRSGFWRWTAAQQAGFAKVLLEEIGDEDKSDNDKRLAIKQLSLLAYCPITPLLDFANDTSHPVFQETALRNLGRLDDNRGVSTLIDALSDDRARIAIYALRGSLRSMSKPATLALLESVPKDKITVRKETIRLIGDLGTEEAFQHLLAVSKEADLHRDIHIALLRSLWLFLDKDQTWAIYRHASVSGEVGIAKASADMPSTRLSQGNSDQMLNIALSLLNHEEAQVRLHALGRCIELKLQDPKRILVPKLLELIHKSGSEAEAAARVIFVMHGCGTDTAVVEELYAAVLQDQKLLRKVHDDVYLDIVSPEDSDKHTRHTTHAILNVLKIDRLSVLRRVKTMFGALPSKEIRPYLLGMTSELHPDALILVCKFLEAEKTDGHWSYDSESKWRRTGDIVYLEEMEKKLRDGDEKCRRLGLSMLIGNVEARNKGWSLEDRELLSRYTEDEDPGVAEKAWSVATPDVQEDDDEDEKTEQSE